MGQGYALLVVKLYLDAADATALKIHHFESIVAVVNLFVLAGEVALQLEQQSGKRVGIAFHLGKLIVVDANNLAEVAQQRLSLKDVRVVVEL